MGKKIANIIGNGDQAMMFNDSRRGLRITCNLPPFAINNVYATTIVDFKMCRALNDGSVDLSMLNWICGSRPRIYCLQQNPAFYHKFRKNIRMFYTTVPDYAENATNFNCGHVATHYASNQLESDEIHLWGFDSLFDSNMRSFTDTVLISDRGIQNNQRLMDLWRPIWESIFNEFPETEFVLHHPHTNVKLTLPDNARVETK